MEASPMPRKILEGAEYLILSSYLKTCKTYVNVAYLVMGVLSLYGITVQCSALCERWQI